MFKIGGIVILYISCPSCLIDDCSIQVIKNIIILYILYKIGFVFLQFTKY